jgi:type I restriction enzyme, R subunit
MSEQTIGQKEKATQDRLIKLFKTKLDYTYLGNWEERENNSNAEEELVIKFLKKQKYSDTLINKALHELTKLASNQVKSLYDTNKELYTLLRYGAKIKESVDKKKEDVFFIDWNNPLNNDFYVAEEVTVAGQHNKRPDIVLYVNGIALGIIELKRSTVSVTEGIRQNLDNQKAIFIQHFFNTIQLVMAGNDTEGLRYGVIETPEKYYLEWKEKSRIKNRLDKHIVALCNKERLIELIHDFIVYDSGIKKICRHNQFFGVKSSQEFLRRREGGIIWHTQGSGKSLTMVWLAKWLKEHKDDSRILIITDRDELDKQIEKVFKGVNEKIYRTKSGRDLISKLNDKEKSLMCSLVHKFGRKQQDSTEEYIKELKKSLPKDFKAKGDIYVFVDECHRTQSGKLHDAMKEILPNAIFIGFTGTPLLKKDKKTSIEVFGRHIHTYKFDEAVLDKVILDLQYEARDIDQKLTSEDKVDAWFDAKTKGLTKYAKTELKKRWGTMQKVLSSKSRLGKIVSDVMFDMATKDRLQSGRGNALLVAGSVYQACKYYELFQKSGLKKCAIITSYNPHISNIKGESTGEDEEDTENIQKYEIYQGMLKYYKAQYPEINDIDTFEEVIKKKFVEEPGQMKLLIVVNKLLTGFDAPPATYLYIDQSMQDHGLFQAICRINRLDGEDKEYGYVVDYKDLFKSVNKAVSDYTTEAFDGFDANDVKGLLKDRISTARENLDNTLEAVKALCEPVKTPKTTLEFIEFFCGNTEDPEALKNTEDKRFALYKLTSKLIRAYANLASEMSEAGYSEKETVQIKKDVKYYENVRMEIKLASKENIDLKSYEPAMRHLIDSYIDAEESKVVSAFEDLTLIDLIVNNSENALDSLPKGFRKNKEAVAEAIENNVRRLITDEKPTNPKYYEKMSALLDELIHERKIASFNYKKYLQKIKDLVDKVKNPSSSKNYPATINSNAKRALYDNFGSNKEFVVTLDQNIAEHKTDGWRGNKIKTKKMMKGIVKAIKEHKLSKNVDADDVLKLVEEQNEY